MDNLTPKGCVLCGWQKFKEPSQGTSSPHEMIICPRCAVPIQYTECETNLSDKPDE